MPIERRETILVGQSWCKLTLAERSSFSDPAVLLTVRELSMGATPTGQLDVTNNGLIVDYSGTSPHDYIKSLFASAYAGGAWTGSGITSSTAAAESDKGIGYAEASALEASVPPFFGTVDATALLARYTFYADANLDTRVNLQDFNRLSANLGTGNDWVEGDFNYDSLVNLQDFNRLAGLFGSGPLDPDGGDGGGEGLRGGEPEYTYDELLAMLMQMNPGYFG